MMIFSLLQLLLGVAIIRRISAAPTQSIDVLRFLSYNVRYDAQPNSITVQQSIDSLPKDILRVPSYYANTAEQPWSTRRLYVADDILFNRVDLFSGQELVKRQVDDLKTLLGSDYAFVGVGRIDGKEAGEYTGIFYKTSALKLDSWDTFWLSNSPFEPSKYPGANTARTCTAARFITSAGRPFTVLNTHLDNESADQRNVALSLILQRAKFEAAKDGRPVILMGDFNSQPSDNAYQIATGAAAAVSINETFVDKYKSTRWNSKTGFGVGNFTFHDLLGKVEPQNRIGGNHATATGFRKVGVTTGFARIDYIMGLSNGGWKALRYRVAEGLSDDGTWHSDHRQVFADIQL